jgi:hypothetical protein
LKRYHKILLAVCVLLLVGLPCVFTFKAWTNSAASSRRISQDKLVGTWKNLHGNVFDFRRDGTVRSRWTGDQTKAISYFRYRLVGDELCIDSANPYGYLQRVVQVVFGMKTERTRVLTLTDDELGLVDSRSGATVIFERS